MRRKIIIIIGSILLIGVVVVLTHQYFYYQEFNSIKNELSQNKAIKNFELHVGNYDTDIEEIYGDIQFNDGTLIRFENLIYPMSFNDTFYVQIRKVNNWKFETHSFRESTKDYYSLRSLSFGKHGQLNDYVSSKILNVKDAIDHRMEIVDLVQIIPEYPKMAIIKHMDWHNRPTITFISKYHLDEEPIWSYDKFENKYDSIISISEELKRKTAYNSK